MYIYIYMYWCADRQAIVYYISFTTQNMNWHIHMAHVKCVNDTYSNWHVRAWYALICVTQTYTCATHLCQKVSSTHITSDMWNVSIIHIKLTCPHKTCSDMCHIHISQVCHICVIDAFHRFEFFQNWHISLFTYQTWYVRISVTHVATDMSAHDVPQHLSLRAWVWGGYG